MLYFTHFRNPVDGWMDGLQHTGIIKCAKFYSNCFKNVDPAGIIVCPFS